MPIPAASLAAAPLMLAATGGAAARMHPHARCIQPACLSVEPGVLLICAEAHHLT